MYSHLLSEQTESRLASLIASIMTQNVQTPQIDRLTLLFDLTYPKKNFQAIERHNDYLKPIPTKMRKYGYANTLSTASGLHIDVAPFNQTKVPHIRIDFNPNNFNPKGSLYFLLLSFAKHIRISRIDFNLDYDIDLSPYKWQTETARSQVQFLTSKDGLETLYLGSKTSSDMYRIYDKAKEQKDTTRTLWRIEHVLRLGINDNYTDLKPFSTLYGWKPDTFTGDYFDDTILADLHANPKNFGRLSRRKQTYYRELMKDNQRTIHLPQSPEEIYLSKCQPLNDFLWKITTGTR